VAAVELLKPVALAVVLDEAVIVSLAFDSEDEFEAAKVSFVKVVLGIVQVPFSCLPIRFGKGFQFFFSFSNPLDHLRGHPLFVWSS